MSCSYKDELLPMAVDLGNRLLLAFDTATGIPYSRINLRHGLDALSRKNTATCTACAGTMLLEFGALSRFVGDPKFERAARRAMEALWSRRAVNTELVGETINITSGAWARTDAGIGAGIDSYYEYLLKSYILFGDETYFNVFELHYDSVMSHLRSGPFIFHGNMHRPKVVVRSHLDSLQMFWPGLQVLHGDLDNAKEMHRMHCELAQRYDFAPEGYTTEFNVHWGNWPLRPEFIESTYFLYKATKDPFYLDVGKQMVDDLQKFTKVECGFAAIMDVRKKTHEDKMDSFFLAETVKYLYLLFAEPEDVIVDMDDFVCTTEAHFLPLSLSRVNLSYTPFNPIPSPTPSPSAHPTRPARRPGCVAHHPAWSKTAFMALVGLGPGSRQCFRPTYELYAAAAKNGGATKIVISDADNFGPPVPYDPKKFIPPDGLNVNRQSDLDFLRSMGIFVNKVEEGIRLTHHATLDSSNGQGLDYMKRLIQMSAQREKVMDNPVGMASIRLASPTDVVGTVMRAGQAAFGANLDEYDEVYGGTVVVAEPLTGCEDFTNHGSMSDRVVLVQRGQCMFVDKVRNAQAAGAAAVIVMDDRPVLKHTKPFTMSGDGNDDDIIIPAVFVNSADGVMLKQLVNKWGATFSVEISSTVWDAPT
eukprot:m.77752 g.77752  ORF g.77752 m.77752 type:complete len:645 (+) comp9160_c0_seq1:37-1971(+)